MSSLGPLQTFQAVHLKGRVPPNKRFELHAFQNSQPSDWAKVGVAVSGTVYTGIDPFFYCERLKDEPGMPDVFREWNVRRILFETTPWTTSTNPQGGRLMAREGASRTFAEVQKTDAWHDDDGHGHYLLECDLQSAGQPGIEPDGPAARGLTPR